MTKGPEDSPRTGPSDSSSGASVGDPSQSHVSWPRPLSNLELGRSGGESGVQVSRCSSDDVAFLHGLRVGSNQRLMPVWVQPPETCLHPTPVSGENGSLHLSFKIHLQCHLRGQPPRCPTSCDGSAWPGTPLHSTPPSRHEKETHFPPSMNNH